MKLISSSVLFQSLRFIVKEDFVEHGDGLKKSYVYMSKPNAVLVIPVVDNKVGLIEVDRYLVKGKSLEVVGGRVENNETPENAAIREMSEEVGLRVTKLEHLFQTIPLPSVSNEIVDVFIADVEGLDNSSLQKDEHILGFRFYNDEDLFHILCNSQIISTVDALALTHYLLVKKKYYAKD